MSKMFTGSICASDIDKSKLTKGKNGKLYLPIVVWLNNEKDKFGNIASIQISQSKEEREAKEKPIYIGNLKEFSSDSKPTQEEPDDFPF